MLWMLGFLFKVTKQATIKGQKGWKFVVQWNDLSKKGPYIV